MIRRSDFIKIVLSHHPTWETKKYGSDYVQFIENNTFKGGVTSFSPFKNKTFIDNKGRHLAVMITYASGPELKILGAIHGLIIAD